MFDHIESISVTTDAWSSDSQDSYIYLTRHFLDKNNNFKNINIDCL